MTLTLEMVKAAVAAVTAQGAYSVRQGDYGGGSYLECMYRHPNGLRCIVGHMISDADYSPSMEGLAFPNGASSGSRHDPFTVLFGLDQVAPALIALVAELQAMHDTLASQEDPFEDWLQKSSKLLEEYETSAVDT